MQRSVSAPVARLRSIFEDGELPEGGVQITRAPTPSREKPEWEAVSPRRVSFEERVQAWERRLGFVSPDRYTGRSHSGNRRNAVSIERGTPAADRLDTSNSERRSFRKGGLVGDTHSAGNGKSVATPGVHIQKEMTAAELFKVSRGLRIETESRDDEETGMSPEEFRRTAAETERDEPAARRGAALWSFNLAMHSDLTVQVDSLSFQVHKSAVCARSGILARLTSARPHSERARVELSDLPGGEKTFELVLRFCYGERLHMTPGNTAGLRCAADYLEMTEDFSPPGHLNLLTLTDAFLDGVALRTMTDALKVLLSCQGISKPAEACNLPVRAMEAIADHVINLSVEALPKPAPRPDLFPTEHLASEKAHASGAPGADLRPPVNVPSLREKWLRQLSKLEVSFFARLMKALETRGVDYRLVGSLIVLYTQSSCGELFDPGESTEHEEGATVKPDFPLHTSLPSFSFAPQPDVPGFQSLEAFGHGGEGAEKSDYARGLEVLLTSLPEPLDAITPGSACALLAIARRFGLPPAFQEDLAERIIGQLALVSAEDLILVTGPGESGGGLDQNWVLKIVDSFLDGPNRRTRAARVRSAGAAAQRDGVLSGSLQVAERAPMDPAAHADVANLGDDVSSKSRTAESAAKVAPEEGGVDQQAKQPSWLITSLQSRRRSKVTSLSPEKCASPPTSGVKKPRAKGWRFRGRKANGTKSAEMERQESESGPSGQLQTGSDDVGVTKKKERQPPSEIAFAGGLSATVTEPKTEGSVQVESEERWEKEGDKNVLVSPLDVAVQAKWSNARGESYRGLQRCSGLGGSGESEDLYVNFPCNSPTPGLWEEPDPDSPVGGLERDARGNVPGARSQEPGHDAHVSPAKSGLPSANPVPAKDNQGLEVLTAAARPSRGELLAVGRLIDEYLRVVGQDPDFGVTDFCAFASCLPGDARADDDGLYVALGGFLKAHPTISRDDEFLLCDCIDWYKLTEAAREDATANDVIPDHVRMEVLTIEQRILKERLREGAAAAAGSDAPVETLKHNVEAAEAFYGGATDSATQGLAAATEAGGGPGLRVIRECATLKRAHQRLAIEGALVKMRLAELERDHHALIQETNRRARFCGCFRGGGREPADVSKSDQYQ